MNNLKQTIEEIKEEFILSIRSYFVHLEDDEKSDFVDKLENQNKQIIKAVLEMVEELEYTTEMGYGVKCVDPERLKTKLKSALKDE